MNNQGSINERWIDRDTYQKNFSILSRRSSVIESKEFLNKNSPFNDKTGINQSQVAISGFYHKEKDRFVSPQIELIKSDTDTPSLKEFKKKAEIPFVTFVLKEKGKTIQTIERWAFPAKMEILYKNKAPESHPFPLSHIMAIFNLPKDSDKRNLQIFVLNQKGEVIYFVPVPKWEKKGKVALVDKTTQ